MGKIIWCGVVEHMRVWRASENELSESGVIEYVLRVSSSVFVSALFLAATSYLLASLWVMVRGVMVS